MGNTTLQKTLFDTSALRGFISDGKGASKVERILHASSNGKCDTLASTLTAYELILTMGKRNVDKSVSAVSFFEMVLDFIPPTLAIAQNAALLKLKYPGADISLADAIILQTGIEQDARIITGDKEWKKITDADVEII